MLTPSSSLPPISRGVDPAKYHDLGKAIPRGDKRKIMSNSELKRFAACPSRWIRGHEKEQTDSLEWGSLIDCLLLTPDRFEAAYAICPETYPAEGKKKGDPMEEKPWNWNATYCKQWRAEHEACGKTVVKPDLCSEAHAAKARLLSDPLLRQFIDASDAQVQVCVDYHDDQTGLVIPIKCLMDLVPGSISPFANMLGDLKSACTAAPGAWEKAVFKEGYHIQAALYLDAFNVVTGENRDTFVHAVQESFAPYETARRMLSEEYLTIGRAAYQRALTDYCYCLSRNEWPGLDEADNRGRIINGWRLVEPDQWMVGAA